MLDRWRSSMKFYGYGTWEDTLESFRSIVPDWFAPGIMHIDVEEGVAGKAQLRAAAREIDPSKKVVLSARAQKALLAIMQDDHTRLSAMFRDSAALPPEVGNQVRAAVVTKQEEIENRLSVLKRAQQDALRIGIPMTLTPEQVQRTDFGIGTLILFGVIAVAIIAVLGWMVVEAINSEEDSAVLSDLMVTLAAAGKWDTMGEIFGGYARPKTSPFPWGWLLGIGASVAGLGLLWAYGTGYMEAKGARIAKKR